MLSTDEALIVALFISIFSLIVAFASMLIARSARSYAAACTKWVENYAKQREPESQIAALSAELTELTDAYAALLKSHKKLRSRITMRENRQKGPNGLDSETVPTDEAARIAYKSRLRAKLRAEGKL